MLTSLLHPVNINTSKQVCDCYYLDDELAVFDEIAKIPMPKEPRRMACIFMALCLDGTATYKVDTKEYHVKKGDVIIISTNQVTDNYALSADCNGMAFMMSDNFFREIISGIHEISSLFLFSRQHPVCHLEQHEVDITKSYLKALIYKLKETDHHYRRQTVISLLRTMIYDLGNVIYRIMQNQDGRNTRADKIFADFILLVENNYHIQRRVGWYALNMGITPKYLSEMVRTASRRTPNEWIDDYVTLELRVLLRNTTKSIKEITEEMQFPNQSFLGKYFKEHVGVSPSAYRKYSE